MQEEQSPKRKLDRRRFLKKAAIVTLGGAATLSGLAACGETAQPTAAATPTTQPTAQPTATTAAPTATSVPVPTATTPPQPTATPAPTATVAPSPTPSFQAIKFAVLGDIRTAGAKPPQVAYQIIEKIKVEQPQAVILVGDIINAESSPSAVRNQWANLNTAIATLAPAAILPTVGNHDTNGQKTVLPLFNEAFPKLPANGPETFKGITYSIDVGSVHFVSITSEHPARFHFLGDEQLDWLEKDLAANKKPYTFVFSHDPGYPAGPHTGSSLDAYPQDRDRLWKMMQTYKVTAYIAGHEHLYNRAQKAGLTQLIIGTSGSAIYGGYGGEFYHYGIFEVKQDGIKVQIFDSQGKQRDSFNLL